MCVCVGGCTQICIYIVPSSFAVFCDGVNSLPPLSQENSVSFERQTSVFSIQMADPFSCTCQQRPLSRKPFKIKQYMIGNKFVHGYLHGCGSAAGKHFCTVSCTHKGKLYSISTLNYQSRFITLRQLPSCLLTHSEHSVPREFLFSFFFFFRGLILYFVGVCGRKVKEESVSDCLYICLSLCLSVSGGI